MIIPTNKKHALVKKRKHAVNYWSLRIGSGAIADHRRSAAAWPPTVPTNKKHALFKSKSMIGHFELAAAPSPGAGSSSK